MWGNWLFVTLGGIGVVLVLLAATFLFSPILAIVIAVVALVATVPLMSARRSRSEGAKVGGSASPSGRRERRSSRVSGGIWGERRET